MTLEQQFRNGLAGQLSSDKTEVEIRVAVKIARDFAIGFSEWLANQEYSFRDRFTNEILLNIFEDEIYSK